MIFGVMMMFGNLALSQGFTELASAPFQGVAKGAVKFLDVDGDGDSDLILTGDTGQLSPFSKLYINDGLGNYEISVLNEFTSIYDGSVDASDIDNDGDLDLFLTGFDKTATYAASLYLNDGGGVFTEDLSHTIKGVKDGSVKFFDADGDSDYDLIVTGTGDTTFDPYTQLYINDGQGQFALDTLNSFVQVKNSWVAFADVNDDSSADLIITGRDSFDVKTANLYLNDGAGIFSMQAGVPFDGVWQGKVEFADVDKDADMDVFIVGRNNEDERIAKLYTNDGTGSFEEETSSTFEGVFSGHIAFADLNNNSSTDLIVTGKNSDNESTTKVYLNDGNGKFTVSETSSIIALESSRLAVADVNNDNFNDVFIAGWNGTYLSKLYINDAVVSSTDYVNVGDDFAYVYPNPCAADVVSIGFYADATGEVVIRLFSADGKIIHDYGIIGQGANDYSVDVSSLSSGQYYMQILSDQQVTNIEFVKI